MEHTRSLKKAKLGCTTQSRDGNNNGSDQSSYLSLPSSEIIPEQYTSKQFSELSKTSKNRTLKKMLSETFGMFSRHRVDRESSLAFVHQVRRELGDQEAAEDSVQFCEAVEDQYKTLNQDGKRSLVSLLTHKEGGCNEAVLQHLPFLRDRSEKLIRQPGRKDRADKIDLSFVSHFMHDYCRYCSVLHACIVYVAIILFTLCFIVFSITD